MIELGVIFILAGLAAGFMAGLLGIGGGFVVVPVLIWAFPLTGIPAAQIPHFAIGTSLLCICITAIASARAHHRRQAVDWSIFKISTPGLVVGALMGSALAALLQGKILIAFFVIGAIATALYLLSGHQPKPHPSPARWPYFAYANFTGMASALIGIGGGSILVPFLVYKGQPMVKSVGTAAACGFPIALFAALGYGITGWKQTASTDFALGYLYLPAFAGIVIFSTISAPFGAKLAHYLSERRLKQVFAVFLFFTSGQILYSHWF